MHSFKSVNNYPTEDVCSGWIIVAGIPPHIDPAELVVTWRLRTHADMFSTGDASALEPVSQSDTVTSQHYDQYTGSQSDDAGTDPGCMFTELLSAAELNATSSSAQQVHPPSEQQPNGLLPCIVPPGLVHPNTGAPASMPFINQNGQIVFLPQAPTNTSNLPLQQPPSVSTADESPSLRSSVVTATQSSAGITSETDTDTPAVSSSTEEQSECPNVSVADATGSVFVEPADSSVTELASAPVDLASSSKTESPECDSGHDAAQRAETTASCFDGIEPVSPASDEVDETLKTNAAPTVADGQALMTEQSLFVSTSQPSVISSGVVHQQASQFAAQPQMSAQRPFTSHQQAGAPMGMMPPLQPDGSVQGSSMQGTLVLHNGQLLLVNQNQPHPLPPANCGVNALGPAVPPNMAVSGPGTIFVNQVPTQPPQQPPAVAPPMPPLGPNQTVMVNTPSGPMTLNTVPSQPNQHPSALILPNGQIVPVVTQPNLLFPPQQCTPVTGGLLIPTPPSQPMVNFVPPASASPRMSSFTTTPMPAPVVTVAAGNVPGAGLVRGLVQVPSGQQPGFPGSQPVQVGPGSVIQAVPAQGHVPSSQSTIVSSAPVAAPHASVPNLPHTVMATMTAEGTIILTMPQSDTQQKTGSKTKKSTVPRPLMPKPTITAGKTDGSMSSCSVATTALNFLTPACLPSLAPPTSNIMPMVSGATYMLTNGTNIAGPNISLAPLPAVANNSSMTPLAVSLAPDVVSQRSIDVSKTTDILAKATESIFMLSPPAGDHLSPSALCLSQSENQLQIDISGTVEHPAQPVRPNKPRSHSKKKAKVSMPMSDGHAEGLAADPADAHSILDQLEGGEGDDEQSDINDFSDLIRLEPMTPRQPTSIAKEASVEKSAETIDKAQNVENSTDDLVEADKSCPTVDALPVEPELPLQDSDDEEVVEIDLTEEDPVSPVPAIVVHEEQTELDVEPDGEPSASVTEEPPTSTDQSELEPLSSSSKNLFERLEEALLSSSTSNATATSSLPCSIVTLASTALTSNTTGSRKSARNLEKSAATTVTESSKGNETSAADICATGTSLIDRIGKVLTMEKKNRSADHKNKKAPLLGESVKDDKHIDEGRTQSVVGTDMSMDHTDDVMCVTDVKSSGNDAVMVDPAVSVNKSQSEAVVEKRHRRSRKTKEKLKEKPHESAVAAPAEQAVGLEPFDETDVKKSATEVDVVSADGKHKGFALSNFLPESTRLSESTSAADLLEQSLCMATDDRQKTANNLLLDASTDELNERTFESVEVPSILEEDTQTAIKELKKDRSKKHSHKSSCNGIDASNMPDTLTFNANELLNIVDVVESMAVETQVEKIKKSHHRKHKAPSVSNGEIEIPSKRKKKGDSFKHANHNSGHVEKTHADVSGVSEGERERHSKHRTDGQRAAMAPKNDPMDVFNFTSDDIVPLDVVSSYSPYRNIAKKQTDESSQEQVSTAKLSAVKSGKSAAGGDKRPDNKVSRLSKPTVESHVEVPPPKKVQSENKENHGRHKKLGKDGDADVTQTVSQRHLPTADMAEPGDGVTTQNSDVRSSDEVSSKSVTARHSNIATLARHVVPPKMHGSTPRSAAKLTAQSVRSRTEPEVGDSASDIISMPSPKVSSKNAELVQRQSSPVNELLFTDSQTAADESTTNFNSPSFTDLAHDETNEPSQAHNSVNLIETKAGCVTTVSSESDVISTSVVLSCQSEAVISSQAPQVTLVSSSRSSVSQVAPVSMTPSTSVVSTDATAKAHVASAVSSCSVSQSESQLFTTEPSNQVQSCSHESSGTVVDAGSRSYSKNSLEVGDSMSTGYVDIDENVNRRSSSVGSHSDSVRRHTAETASYDRGYCDNYAASEVAVRSRSSGGSCSVESHSVSTAQASLQCDRAINSASVSSLNSSSSLRSNCSQKISTSADGRNSRSSGGSQVGSVYGGNMDCSAGTKHRSSCQEDSRQRQMIESEFFAPRAALSSSCAVQNNIATSMIEPFQYPYAAMNGAQPQPHHDMSLASIAAAEYGFVRHPFPSFPPPFGFDPQPSVRGPPGRFSPLSHNLPSCGVEKQTHKSATGNSSMRSGQEPTTEMSKSRHHQQQVCSICLS